MFVESLGLRRPTASARDVRRMAKRLAHGLRPLRADDGLHVLSPLVVPYYGSSAVRALNQRILRALVRRSCRKLGLRHPVLWAYVPQALALVETLQPRLVVYHCVDDISAHHGIDRRSFLQAEEAFVREADLVIASSEPLAERLATFAEKVRLMPNVADTDAFSTALSPGPVDAMVQAAARPRIVFVGAVSAVKVDLELVAGMARLRRDWSFLLVGPVGLGDPDTDVSALREEPNVHLLGPRRHEDLPAVLRGADAGIIPYRLSPLTASVFPMKLYEYLAAGLPTVATRLPSLAGVAGVGFADDAASMCAELQRVLDEDSPAARQARSEGAAGHSWEARIAEIEDAVGGLRWRR